VIAIDTNIVVRFLTADDATQFEQAAKLFREANIFIPDSVILETEWVLRFAYDFSPTEIVDGLRKLLGLSNVQVDSHDRIAKILDWHKQGLDFADALHLANSGALSELVTFDAKFIKRAKDLSNCRVRLP
jgi:predicted nucleic-acid-binding protein